MEQSESLTTCGSVCYNRVPPLSVNYQPWLISQNLEPEDKTEDQQEVLFLSIYDDTCHYRCRIPELVGKRINGYYHGWVILSDHPHNVMWSLWNPLTSKIIRLPPLILKNGQDSKIITECCLSSSPDEPCSSSSVLLLTSTDKPIFVFCRLDHQKKKRLRWTEMSYSKQLKTITGDGNIIHNLTCCDGKLFALSTDGSCGYLIILVDILFMDNKEVVIQLVPFGRCPFPSMDSGSSLFCFLKGSCSELFYIIVGLREEPNNKKTFGTVNLFRLDVSGIKHEEFKVEDDDDDDDDTMWEESEDLKDGVFFVDLRGDMPVSYSRVISPELGGYVHICDANYNMIHSYHVKDNTISLSLMPSLVPVTSHLSVWEYGLEGGDNGEAKCSLHSKQKSQEDDDEQIVARSSSSCVDEEEDEFMNESSHLLPYLPSDILDIIIKFCVGVEYMFFRATCKLHHSAAPLIRWSNDYSMRRLHNYSLVSPWLMVVGKKHEVITCIDPVFGDRYFMNKSYASNFYGRICYSGFGWLLLYSNVHRRRLIFFNPFTNEIRELPLVPNYLNNLWFSAPPTSNDCMVVGFSTTLDDDESLVYILHFVAKPQTWRAIRLDFVSDENPSSFSFPTLVDNGIYTLCNDGQLYVFQDIWKENYSWKQVEVKVPSGNCVNSPSFFLLKCDGRLLLVVVDENGESVEVFKLIINDDNDSSSAKKSWEKIDGLGRYMIYISDSTCLCIQAKIPEMENKIFFSRLHSEEENLVFYSLDTRKYHTFNDKNIQQPFENFFGTKHFLSPHAWIEPCWSCE